MLLSELFDDDLAEGAKMIWARSGNKVVRKYRCTSGKKKGRIVATAAGCGAPINVKKRLQMKKTKLAKGKKMTKKALKTKRTNPASRRVQKMNKGK